MIPEEHLAIIRANAADPAVKARFKAHMAAEHAGLYHQEAPEMSASEQRWPVFSKAPAAPGLTVGQEQPAFGHPLPAIGPPVQPMPSAERSASNLPTRHENGATYISLHGPETLPDVGPPQYMRDMTHPVDGISDPATRAALQGQPLLSGLFGLLANADEPTVGDGRENKEEDVRKLQEALKKLGYDPGAIDGKWGEKTKAALKKFQKDRELPDDGIAGPKTWGAINKALEELEGPDEGKGDQPPGETVPPSKRNPANGYPKRSPGKDTPAPPCAKKRMAFDDKRDGPFKGHGETGLVDPPMLEPGPNAKKTDTDRPDNTDRTKDGFKPVVDKGATDALIAGWDTYVAEDACNCCCEMPEFDTTQYGNLIRSSGTRQYNKYDKVFIAAVTWWVSSCPKLKALNNCKCICEVARLLKCMAWQESNVGYGSGYGEPFLDTEDVMQVGFGDDGKIRKDKLPELKSTFGDCVNTLSPPDELDNRNISGEQSIFYGTGWFFRKMMVKGASCEANDLLDAAEAYNGNNKKDPNGLPHKVNYKAAVKGVFETGKFHDPKSGKQMKGGNGKDEIFIPPSDDC